MVRVDFYLFLLSVIFAKGFAVPIPSAQCDNADCDDLPECPKTTCRCLYPSKGYCNIYYQCVEGTPRQYSCSQGLLFNEETLTCDYDFKVDCKGKIVPEIAVTSTTVVSTDQDLFSSLASTLSTDNTHPVRSTAIQHSTPHEIETTSDIETLPPYTKGKETTITESPALTTESNKDDDIPTSNIPATSTTNSTTDLVPSEATNITTEVTFITDVEATTTEMSNQTELTESESTAKSLYTIITKHEETTITGSSTSTIESNKEDNISTSKTPDTFTTNNITDLVPSEATNSTRIVTSIPDVEVTTTEMSNQTKSTESESTAKSLYTTTAKYGSTTEENIVTENDHRSTSKTALTSNSKPDLSTPQTEITTVTTASTSKQESSTTVHLSSVRSSTLNTSIQSTTEMFISTTNSSVRDDTKLTDAQTTNSDLSTIPITSQATSSLKVTEEPPHNFTCVSRFGLYADPSSCNYFYQCSHFIAYHKQCPSDLHFNAVLQVCDWPYEAGCERRTSPKTEVYYSTTAVPTHQNLTSSQASTDNTDETPAVLLTTIQHLSSNKIETTFENIFSTETETLPPHSDDEDTGVTKSSTSTTESNKEEDSSTSPSPVTNAVNNTDLVTSDAISSTNEATVTDTEITSTTTEVSIQPEPKEEFTTKSRNTTSTKHDSTEEITTTENVFSSTYEKTIIPDFKTDFLTEQTEITTSATASTNQEESEIPTISSLHNTTVVLASTINSSIWDDTMTTEHQITSKNITTIVITSPTTTFENISSFEVSDEPFYNFTCLSRFGLFPDPANCSYFYQCSHFTAHHMKCPSNLHFNPVLLVCDWPYEAGCENNLTKTTGSPSKNFSTNDSTTLDPFSTSKVTTISSTASPLQTDITTNVTLIKTTTLKENIPTDGTGTVSTLVSTPDKATTNLHKSSNYITSTLEDITDSSTSKNSKPEELTIHTTLHTDKSIIETSTFLESTYKPKELDITTVIKDRETTIHKQIMTFPETDTTFDPSKGTSQTPQQNVTIHEMSTLSTKILTETETEVDEIKTTERKETKETPDEFFSSTGTLTTFSEENTSVKYDTPTAFRNVSGNDDFISTQKTTSPEIKTESSTERVETTTTQLQTSVKEKDTEQTEGITSEETTQSQTKQISGSSTLFPTEAELTMETDTRTETEARTTKMPETTAIPNTTVIYETTKTRTLDDITGNEYKTSVTPAITKDNSSNPTTTNTKHISEKTEFPITQTEITRSDLPTTKVADEKDGTTIFSTESQRPHNMSTQETESQFTEESSTVGLTSMTNTSFEMKTNNESETTANPSTTIIYITQTSLTDETITNVTDQPPDFLCPSRFGLFPDPKSCFKFYQCSHWLANSMECPSNLHFNPILMVCDWPYAAGCENATTEDAKSSTGDSMGNQTDAISLSSTTTMNNITEPSRTVEYSTTDRANTTLTKYDLSTTSAVAKINITGRSTTKAEEQATSAADEVKFRTEKEFDSTNSPTVTTTSNMSTANKSSFLTVVELIPENSEAPETITPMKLSSTKVEYKSTSQYESSQGTKPFLLTTKNSNETVTFTEPSSTAKDSESESTILQETSSGSVTDEAFMKFECPSRFGLFPDTKSCFRFFHCSHWIPYHKRCPSGLHFNAALEVCDYPYDAGCDSSFTTQNEESGTEEIKY